MTLVCGVLVHDICNHMKAAGYSETVASLYQTTRRHTPKDRNLDIYQIEKIKYHTGVICFSSGWAKSPRRHVEMMINIVNRVSARKAIPSAIRKIWGRGGQARQECGVALGYKSTHSPNTYRHVMKVTSLLVFWWVDYCQLMTYCLNLRDYDIPTNIWWHISWILVTRI
jgi:hypothetical protein